MNKSMLILFVFTLSACSGRVYTVKNLKFDSDKEEGVIFYGYKPKTVDVVLDRIRHPKTGDITHSMYEDKTSPKYCEPVTQQTTIIEPDYSTMYSIVYEPGWFETNKFGVVLENGTLKSVNSESTPGLKVAVEALGTLVGIAKDVMLFSGTSSSGKLACSANK